MQQFIEADAAALAKDIDRTGHRAVYGILFDTGKADIQADRQAVAEIANLLEGFAFPDTSCGRDIPMTRAAWRVT